MNKTKSIEALRKMLNDFEQDITRSIAAELERIGRTVAIDELDYIPFREDVRDYIDAIRLDEDKNPVLDASFQDVTEKYLSRFISDNEIDHWDMIALLGLLTDK